MKSLGLRHLSLNLQPLIELQSREEDATAANQRPELTWSQVGSYCPDAGTECGHFVHSRPPLLAIDQPEALQVAEPNSSVLPAAEEAGKCSFWLDSHISQLNLLIRGDRMGDLP